MTFLVLGDSFWEGGPPVNLLMGHLGDDDEEDFDDLQQAADEYLRKTIAAVMPERSTP